MAYERRPVHWEMEPVQTMQGTEHGVQRCWETALEHLTVMVLPSAVTDIHTHTLSLQQVVL